jgi:hypothetical protein
MCVRICALQRDSNGSHLGLAWGARLGGNELQVSLVRSEREGETGATRDEINTSTRLAKVRFKALRQGDVSGSR